MKTLLIDEVILGQQPAHSVLAKVLVRNAVFPSIPGSGRESRALCVCEEPSLRSSLAKTRPSAWAGGSEGPPGAHQGRPCQGGQPALPLPGRTGLRWEQRGVS